MDCVFILTSCHEAENASGYFSAPVTSWALFSMPKPHFEMLYCLILLHGCTFLVRGRTLKRLTGIFIFIAALVHCCIGHASDSEALRVAFTTFPPAVFLDDEGNPDGYDIQFLRLFFDRLGKDMELSHVPFQRGMHLLRSGEMDAMLGVLRRPEREEFLLYVEPPYVSGVCTAFYVPRGQEERISRHEDLYGMTVGVGIGVKYYPRFDEDGRIRKDPVRTGTMNFQRLLAGRVDAVAMEEETGDFRLVHQGFGERISKARFVARDPQAVYMVVSRNSPHARDIEDFNRVMARMMKEGVRDRLKEQAESATSPRVHEPESIPALTRPDVAGSRVPGATLWPVHP
jgi:polar amino acid transport system substrate-binding protein